MAQRDLRRLKRLELLDMMIEQGKQLEQQTARAAELEARVQKLEVQLKASEDRIGHLKQQLADAALTNDRLRTKELATSQDYEKAIKDAKDLRKENIVLATKLDDATRQLQHLSGAQLPGLGSSDREALASLAQRMESALQRSQAADAERTARLEAILVSQQEIIDDLTARNRPVSGQHVADGARAPEELDIADDFAEPAPFIQPPTSMFRLGGLGKKKKKKKSK